MQLSNKYKMVVAAVGTVVTALSAAFADDVLGVDEIGNIVATVITAAVTIWGVYQTPNRPTRTQSNRN